MADKVAEFLQMVPTNDRVRAAAWDAIYEAKTDEERIQRLNQLPLDDRVKARIWDLAQEPPEPDQPNVMADMPFMALRGAGQMITGAAKALNPVPIVSGALNAVAHPIDTAKNIYNSQRDQYMKGGQAALEGRVSEAIGHGVASALPLFGPAAANAGERIGSGDVFGGLGQGMGLLALTLGPGAAMRSQVRTPALVSPALTPQEQAAVQFANRENIPVDAATATGNRFVRNAQKRVTESMGGAGTASKFQGEQAQALTRAGNDLASRANSSGAPMNPVSAGQSVMGRLEQTIADRAAEADAAYARLRAIEQQQAQTIARTGGVKAPATAAQPFTNVPLAVDVSAAKAALKPVYDSLLRESQLGIPMMGGKGRALAALDGLMRGPDQAPLSVVDAALGDLKTLARTADLPALRTQGQGVAAHAVQALEQQVTATAQQAGPQVVRALHEGRTATIGKFETAGVREQLSGEPAQIFRQLTANKDVGLNRLRDVARQTPAEIPNIARAYLEDLMDTATRNGKFEHTDRLYAEWNKLGPETKAVLFPDRGLRADLDQFFLLAKKIGENPNPSGTAQVLTAMNVGATPLNFSLAKMLYSRAGVQALTQGLKLSLSPRGAKAARAMVAGQVSATNPNESRNRNTAPAMP